MPARAAARSGPARRREPRRLSTVFINLCTIIPPQLHIN